MPHHIARLHAIMNATAPPLRDQDEHAERPRDMLFVAAGRAVGAHTAVSLGPEDRPML